MSKWPHRADGTPRFEILRDGRLPIVYALCSPVDLLSDLRLSRVRPRLFVVVLRRFGFSALISSRFRATLNDNNKRGAPFELRVIIVTDRKYGAPSPG